MGQRFETQVKAPVIPRRGAPIVRAPAAVPRKDDAKVSVPGSLGHPLDPSTRTFMESRFGQDFSTVRVHSDAAAANAAGELGAAAFTSGEDIFFGSETARGGAEGKVLAHELTHVVQQRGGSLSRGPESASHEDEARGTADRISAGEPIQVRKTPGAPALQMLRTSGGNFGQALEWYTNTFTVPDRVVRLLRLSATFMRMAQALDQRYIALTSQSLPPAWSNLWLPDADGVLTQGPFRGRRVLAVWISHRGSEFLPAGAPENQFGYDIIELEPPATFGMDNIKQWVERIAHETTHAFNRATGSSVAPAGVAAQITAAVEDESQTRLNEIRVVSEIEATRRGQDLQQGRSTTGATDHASVERDFFPGDLRRTYLEQFVLSTRLSQAISNEHLSADDIERRNRHVDQIRLADSEADHFLTDPWPLYFDPSTGLYDTFTSDYEKARFYLRVIDRRWRLFLGRTSPGSATFDAEKEQLLQENARAFFQAIIQYTPRPTAQTTSP